MTYTQQFKAHYHNYVGHDQIRVVWDAVTRTPQASVREIGERIGLSFGCVATALRFLNDAGYVVFAPGSARARTIIVPFAFVRKEPRCSTD